MAKIKKNENISSDDITSLFNTAEKESDFAEKIFNTVREPLLLLDKDLRVVKASRSFYDFFKVTSNKTIGKLIYDLGNRQWNIPKLRELLETILPEKTTFDNYEVEHDFSKIGKRTMLLNARKIPRGLSEEQMILLAIEDITERKQKEESLSEKSRLTNKYLEILLDHAHMPIIIWDSSNIIIRINNEFEKLIGYDWAELRGKKIDFLFPKESLDSTLELLKSKEGDEKIEIMEIDILSKDKNIKTVIWNSANLYDKKGKRIVATIAQDITNRKRAEEALSASERLFHSLAQVSPVGIFKTNAKGYTTYVNPKWSQLSGLSNEYAFGFGWLRAVHPDDRKKLRKGWHESTKAQKVSYSEYRFLHPDGTVVWVMGQATTELDSENKIIGYIGTITDITERKLTEETLKESEKKFRTVVEEAIEIVFTVDNRGYFTYVNPAGLKSSGYSLDELKKLKYLDLIETEFKQRVKRNYFRQFLERSALSTTEYPFRTKSGKIKWFNQNSRLIIEKNEVKGFYVIARDVTERRIAVEALKESEEKHRALIEQMYEGLLVVDNDDVIQYANPMFCKMLGYEKTELIGKIGYKILLDETESIKIIERNCNRLKGISEQYELRMIKKSGEQITVFMNAAPIEDKKGKVTGSMSTCIDITERKQAENALHQSEERFRSLYENSTIGLYRTTPGGKIILANPTLIKMLGYSSFEELAERNLEKDGFEPTYEHKLFLEQIERDGEVKGLESAWTSKNGSEVFLRESAKAIRDSDGKTLYYDGTVEDITVRKYAQQALLESEEKYRSVAQSANDAIITTDSKGIIYGWNKGAEKIFGYTEEEITGKELSLIIPPVNAERHIQEMKQIEESVEHPVVDKTIEVYGIHKNGKRLPLEISLAEWEISKGKFYTGIIRDITERKNAEKTLKQSEEKFRSYVDNAPDGVFVTDETGGYIEVNEAACTMTGYSKSELLKMSIPDILHEESLEASMAHFNKLIQSGTSKSDLSLKHKNGFKRSWSLDAVKLSETRFLGFAKDITERKLAEEKLRNSEERLKIIFDYAPDAYYLNDLKGNFIDGNIAARKLLGYDVNEIIGKSFIKLNILSPIQLLKAAKLLAKNILGQATGPDEFVLNRKDGSKTPVEISTHPVKIKDQTVVLGIARDLTDRKQVEQEIIMLAQSLKSINECVSITDLEDKILFVNEAFLKTYGYEENELIGKHITIVRSPNTKPDLAKEILRATKHGGWVGELLNKRKDGSEFPVYLSTTIINDKEGKPFGLIGVATDITRHKQAEKELIDAKEKAEESNKLKSEFLAQMSHEIRTPINVMIGNVDYLHQSFNEKMDADTRDCFDGIELASKRIIRTVDLILNAAELQTSGYKSQFAEVDLNSEILNKLFLENQLLATQKGLELVYKCVIKETIILADEYSVTQIFANLIDNAIKYTKKGKVEILLGNNKTGKIMVEIKDTGIGINEKFLPKLFEPFTQEEQGYTRSFEGNGLGLALVKKYCEINKATIEVESIKNVATTFRVIFS